MNYLGMSLAKSIFIPEILVMSLFQREMAKQNWYSVNKGEMGV